MQKHHRGRQHLILVPPLSQSSSKEGKSDPDLVFYCDICEEEKKPLLLVLLIRCVVLLKIDGYGHITIHSMAFNFGAIGFGDDSNLHQLSSL
ncbi:hypothetical protein V6N12_005818 [Hibiscus sabdariffa]|uniref:Uncharacterized protein n=1 Tax=Hibiscus sabdariffa TaxID=183260 RepID=A0ABR2AXH9_9ROSI